MFSPPDTYSLVELLRGVYRPDLYVKGRGEAEREMTNTFVTGPLTPSLR